MTCVFLSVVLSSAWVRMIKLAGTEYKSLSFFKSCSKA